MLSPDDLVKEVAKELEQGNLCYVEKSSRSIVQITPDSKNTPETKAQIAKLEEHIERYIKIAPMTTAELIFVMKDFLLEVTDQEIKKELTNGLNRKNPTRNFLQITASRIDINQHWTLFKKEQYETHVEKHIITDYNY